MIPKIIHQIWLQGYDNLPSELKIYHTECQNINNNFVHIFWTDDKIKNLLKNNFSEEYLKLYEFYKVPAQKADFARYIILYMYGGIYLDMDMICKKNLEIFLTNRIFFTESNDVLDKIYKRYQNSIVGAIPKHPLFLIIFKNMFIRKHSSNDITYSTGTRLLYDSAREYCTIYNNDITLVDIQYFHPCGIFDDATCHYTCNKCYTAHTNYSSWSPLNKLIKYFVKNINLIFIFVVILMMVICHNKFVWL